MRIALIILIFLAFGGWAFAAKASMYGGSNQTIISCRDVCIVKAAAPKPGQRPLGHIVRQCFNTLTGQYAGDRPVPFTLCSR